MRVCAEHRVYLAAVADGEIDHVPAASVAHLAECPDCLGEVDLHRALGGKVRAAAAAPRRAATGGFILDRRRAGRVGAAALAAVAVTVAALTLLLGRPDPVLAAAAAAAGRAPQFESGDRAQIGSWCERASGRSMPEVDLAPLAPVGARLDRGAGTDIVTVFYQTPERQRVAVGWLDSGPVPPTGRSVTAREAGGRVVLVATSAHGRVIISGGAPVSALWQAAARLEAGSST